MKTRSGGPQRNRYSPYFRRKSSKKRENVLTTQEKKRLDNVSNSLNDKFSCVKVHYVASTLSASSSDSEVDESKEQICTEPELDYQSLPASVTNVENSKDASNYGQNKDEATLEFNVDNVTNARKSRKELTSPAKQRKRGRMPKSLRNKLITTSQEEKALLDPKRLSDTQEEETPQSDNKEELLNPDLSDDDDFIPLNNRNSNGKQKRNIRKVNRTNVKRTYGRSGLARKCNSKGAQSATTGANLTDEDDEGMPINPTNKHNVSSSTMVNDPANESDSDIEWEDVDHGCHEVDLTEIEKSHENSSISNKIEPSFSQEEKKTIEIDLAPKKRQRAENNAQKYLMRMVNRFSRDLRMNIHKVHALLLIASGFHRNRLTMEPLVKAIFLSMIPSEFLVIKSAKWNIINLTNCLNWFRSAFEISRNYRLPALKQGELVKRLEKRKLSVQDYVHAFIAVLRTLMLPTRLVISLKAIPFKEVKADVSIVENSSINIDKTSTPNKSGRNETIPKEDQLDIAALLQSDSETERNIKPLIKTPAKRRGRPNKSAKKKIVKVQNEDELYSTQRPARKCKTAVKNLKEECEDEDFANSSDSDFIEQMKFKMSIVRRKQKPTKSKDTTLKKQPKSKNCKAAAFESENGPSNELISPVNSWIEVYLKSEKRWICIECINNSIDKPNLVEKTATQPLTYVVTFDDNEKLRDLTSRYADRWLIYNRKLCPDQPWWDETMASYEPSDKKANKKEDEELLENLRSKPMPTTISDFKNHPLYVLRRHLLKYEVIYPEDTEPVGEIRGEAVLPRDSVYTLHTSESWFIKHGRSIKKGEEPVKSVPARIFNPNKIAAIGAATKMNDLYGLWQTEQYRPPRAKNGKVPRNEYGNVEVFFPHMIPPGTVHMKIPNLNRIAQKLKIDCVSVVTGWDYHRGHVYPVTNGYLVCCEFEKLLLDAVREEEMAELQQIRKAKEEQILKRWKRLTKGLLIRDKLQEKYSLDSKTASLKSYKRQRLLKHKKETL